MTLTPEQFNILATKDDLKSFVTKDEFKKGIDDILTALDGMKKNNENHEIEHVSNISAHDRFQRDIDGLKLKVGVGASA